MRVHLACSLILGLLLLLVHSAAAAPTVAAAKSVPVQKCNPGPWGDLEFVTTAIELPDQYAEQILRGIGPTRWFFKNSTHAELSEFFKTVDLDAPTAENLLSQTNWEATSSGIWVFPNERFVLNLKAEARQKIYTTLSGFSENGFHSTPFIFRNDWLAERLGTSGLPESAQQKFLELLYARGAVSLFSDVHAMLSILPDPNHKLRFIKMLHRKRSLLLRLAVTPHTDVSGLLKYWGVQGRAWELKSLIEPLTQIEGGYQIDVTHLLPPFPRSKIYTYPVVSHSLQPSTIPNENCHWTSFNFFNDPPNDKLRDFHFVQEALDKDYDVTNDKQFGDVVVLLSASNVVVHSAVYIADDIVFTKNGGRETQPWVLMKMEDMLPFYNALEPIKVVVCRRKAT